MRRLDLNDDISFKVGVVKHSLIFYFHTVKLDYVDSSSTAGKLVKSKNSLIVYQNYDQSIGIV